jgi:hypothetical protein
MFLVVVAFSLFEVLDNNVLICIYSLVNILAEIIAIHDYQIQNFGSTPRVRDQ